MIEPNDAKNPFVSSCNASKPPLLLFFRAEAGAVSVAVADIFVAGRGDTSEIRWAWPRARSGPSQMSATKRRTTMSTMSAFICEEAVAQGKTLLGLLGTAACSAVSPGASGEVNWMRSSCRRRSAASLRSRSGAAPSTSHSCSFALFDSDSNGETCTCTQRTEKQISVSVDSRHD